MAVSEWKPQPGIYYDIPWSQYITCPYMSPSTLKSGQRSMKRLKRTIDGECKPSAKTTAVGSAVHCIIAGEAEDRIAVMPAFELDNENVTKTGKSSKSKSTEYFKQKSETWTNDNAGKDVLSEVQINVARKVVRNIMAKPECAEIIDKSKSEVTIIAEIEGLMCKTRLDHFAPFLIADTKTTSDIAPHSFYRIAKRLGYFFSAAFHVLAVSEAPGGFETQEYKFIAAEIQDDYDVGLINVPFALIDQYKERVLRVIEKYRLAKASGVFSGLYPMESQLNVPEHDMDSEDELYDFESEVSHAG